LLMSIPEDGLRFFGGGDASFGAWFLAFNVTHMDDMRMCCGACKPNMLGYWEISKCNGICNPETTMARVHTEECGASPTLPRGETELPETRRSYEISKEKCHKVRNWGSYGLTLLSGLRHLISAALCIHGVSCVLFVR
jgi:hypothetical protein